MLEYSPVIGVYIKLSFRAMSTAILHGLFAQPIHRPLIGSPFGAGTSVLTNMTSRFRPDLIMGPIPSLEEQEEQLASGHVTATFKPAVLPVLPKEEHKHTNPEPEHKEEIFTQASPPKPAPPSVTFQQPPPSTRKQAAKPKAKSPAARPKPAAKPKPKPPAAKPKPPAVAKPPAEVIPPPVAELPPVAKPAPVSTPAKPPPPKQPPAKKAAADRHIPLKAPEGKGPARTKPAAKPAAKPSAELPAKRVRKEPPRTASPPARTSNKRRR